MERRSCRWFIVFVSHNLYNSIVTRAAVTANPPTAFNLLSDCFARCMIPLALVLGVLE